MQFTKLVNKAQVASNFTATKLAWNEKRKTFRRIKLYGSEIALASKEQQDLFESNLRKEFGDKFISMYTVHTGSYWAKSSVCIKLAL